MRILVTGGTGFVGEKLVDRLIAQGHSVVVFAKKAGTKRYPPLPNGLPSLSYVEGDIRRMEDVRKAFPVDFVYHLAAGLGEDKESAQVNTQGTRNIVQAWSEARFYQLIYLSSSGVLGETTEPAKEDAPYAPRTRYEKSKRDAEQIIKSKPLSYTIIRAPIIIGANRIWQQIFSAARKSYPIVGSGKNKFHLAALNDVIDLLLLVMRNDHAVNQTFHIATRDIPTYQEVYEMICELLETPMPTKHVSPATAKLGLRLKSLFSRSDVTQRAASIDRLVRNRVLDISKAKEHLGFEPHCDTRSALKEAYEEMRGGDMI